MSGPWSSACRHASGWPSQSGVNRGWGRVLAAQSAVTECRRTYSDADQVHSSPVSGPAEVEESGRLESIEAEPLFRRKRTEAVLLLAKTPLPPRKLAQMAGLSDATEARTMIRELNEAYSDLGRAIRIEMIAGGYRMMTRPAIAPWISRLSHVPKPVRLSTPMMETLAIVAYRGPVSRAAVESVRGVACGELLRQLMERDLVRIAGRSEELGRPYLYDTTKRFLQLFGLPNTDALPKIHWQALQDDSSVEDPDFSTIPDSNPPIDPSIKTKEPVVTNTLVSASPEITSTGLDLTVLTSANAGLQETSSAGPVQDPAAVIEDEEDDLYEGIGVDDSDEEEEGWDDEDDWDDDDDGDDDDDDEEDDDDDLEEDSWEEVDDSDSDSDEDDADEDWDDDDDEDDWDDDDADGDNEDEDDEDWD